MHHFSRNRDVRQPYSEELWRAESEIVRTVFVQRGDHIVVNTFIHPTADPVLVDLLGELSTYPVTRTRFITPAADRAYAELAVPFQLITDSGQLAFLSTTMMFGTPVDITLSELALEFFFPANAATVEAMHRSAGGRD